MDGDIYQARARGTAIYVDSVPPMDKDDVRIVYTVLGLMGELGEFAEKLKKRLRGGENLMTLCEDPAIKGELGDIAWYFSQVCTELGFSVNEVLEANVAKLSDRKDRGVLHGEGDNR